jgi:hypothetical protein
MNDLGQRNFWTLFRQAIFSPLSAVVIAAAIVLIGLKVTVPVVNAQPVAWLVGLLPLWVLVVVGAMVIRRTGAPVAAQLQREEIDSSRITNPHLRTVLTQAVNYRDRIQRLADQFSTPVIHDQWKEVSAGVEKWVCHIYTLVRRLDHFGNIASDSDRTPFTGDFTHGKALLAGEDGAATKMDVKDTNNELQVVVADTTSLGNQMDRAELLLENSLTLLGTMYSQLLLLDARNLDSAKTDGLRESITEQVTSLQDLQSSLDEVYQGDTDAAHK